MYIDLTQLDELIYIYQDYDLIDEGRKRNKVVIMLKHHEPLDRILLYSGADEAVVLSIAEEHGIPIIP